MRIPRATYRTQLTPAFGFQAAREIVPYLAELGISDVYGGGRGRTRLSFLI
jgi:(1->4)-alpha-D-glucan 1-alpha-D-glucosylmutase